MLNTPNEWHNEEYTEDEMAPEEEFAEDEQYDDGDYSDEEYEDDEEYEEDEGDDDGGNSDDSKKKIIIIAIVVAIAVIIIIGGFLGFNAMKNKNSAEPQNNASVEAPVEDASIDIGEDADDIKGDGDEISIDVEVEEEPAEKVAAEDNQPEDGGGLDIPEAEDKKPVAKTEEVGGGLDVPDAQKSALASVVGKTSNTVTVAIGDVGRISPFKPIKENPEASLTNGVLADEKDTSYSFDVIEPPELAPESDIIARLLQTKVTGILFDVKKPSAIVNIDGSDQLVCIGDNIGGFEIVSITKNKVVIRGGSNVYRASVGQPLNAEKIENPVEISNLETKFLGSTKH